MKPSAVVLAGSLAANLALLVVSAFQPSLAPPAFRDLFARDAAALLPRA